MAGLRTTRKCIILLANASVEASDQALASQLICTPWASTAASTCHLYCGRPHAQLSSPPDELHEAMQRRKESAHGIQACRIGRTR